MRDFKDTFVSREYRFSLGINPETNGFYLSTPVSGFNRAAEWEAHFAITAVMRGTDVALSLPQCICRAKFVLP